LSHIFLNEVSLVFNKLSSIDVNLKRQLLTLGRNKNKRQIAALNDINLSLVEGDQLGIIGLNGAGKSTLLEVMCGFLPPSKGKISSSGQILSLLGNTATGLDLELTGKQNVAKLSTALGMSKKQIVKVQNPIQNFSDLGDRFHDPVHTYSTGMKARLRIATILEMTPDILIMDEGIGTTDAKFGAALGERVSEFIQSAGILVLASHDMNFIHRFTTKSILLDQGSIVSSGSTPAVIEDYKKLVN
jgi:ABC-type polysaccharide/polyol phosphate transport system ATPase subunit